MCIRHHVRSIKGRPFKTTRFSPYLQGACGVIREEWPALARTKTYCVKQEVSTKHCGRSSLRGSYSKPQVLMFLSN